MSQPFPFAVRLIGFSPQEEAAFETCCSDTSCGGRRYVRLAEDNLQDADLYVANAHELKALIRVVDLRPTAVRPALLVGTSDIDLPYASVPGPEAQPPNWQAVFAALDALMEVRAEALARLEAADVIAVPERRRRERLDLDLTDPAEYERMRMPVPQDGGVLVVDKNAALGDYLGDLLARRNVSVAWTSNEAEAESICGQRPVAAVLINTSTPGVDPYRLCRAVKEKNARVRIAVVFLVGRRFVYDQERARDAGADGFLNKPLASRHLISVLKKFLPFFR